jgi:hypothetical protein
MEAQRFQFVSLNQSEMRGSRTVAPLLNAVAENTHV